MVYTHTGLKIAIIGRPNVGKSTLFNRLASAVRGRGHEGVANPSPLVFVRSVVDSVPGVTRDPREASAALSDLLMTVVDTPGLEHAIGQCSPLITRMKLNNDKSSSSGSNDAKDRQAVKLSAAAAMCDDPVYRAMYEQMEQKTEEATRDADLIFFVIDAGDGVTVIDKAIAEWLHRVVNESESNVAKSSENETTGAASSSQQQLVDQLHRNISKDGRKNKKKQVMIIANKCDLRNAEHHVTDAYELGFNDPIVVSAEQGLGFADLYAEIDQLHERRRLQRQLKAVATASTADTSTSNDDDVDGHDKGLLVKGYNNPWKREADGCGMEKVDHEREWQRASFDDELVLGYADRPGEEPLRQLVVSIIGRPNVGKSTLLNRLVGESKSLVGPEAGVTRDAVLCQWRFPEAWRHPKHNYGIMAPSNHYRQRECVHEVIHGDDYDDDIISDNGGHVKKHYREEDKSGKGLKFDLPLWLVDTAGVRAQTKVLDEKLEALSVRTSLRALRHSHVVLLVVDALEPLVSQDAKLMDLVVAHGRAVVLVINKMDRLNTNNNEFKRWRDALRYRVDSKLSEVAGVEMVEVSAKTWDNNNTQMKMLFDATLRAWNRWEKRVPTAQLNRFVQRFNERVSVGGGTKGAKRNRRGVTKFVTQRKIRPPMFRLDGASAVSMNYLRALTNAIRHEFGLHGVPIRVKRPRRERK